MALKSGAARAPTPPATAQPFAINFFVILIHYSLVVLLLTAAYNWALMSITVQRLRNIGITDIFKQVACIIVTALLPFLVFLWMVWPGEKR